MIAAHLIRGVAGDLVRDAIAAALLAEVAQAVAVRLYRVAGDLAGRRTQ